MKMSLEEREQWRVQIEYRDLRTPFVPFLYSKLRDILDDLEEAEAEVRRLSKNWHDAGGEIQKLHNENLRWRGVASVLLAKCSDYSDGVIDLGLDYIEDSLGIVRKYAIELKNAKGAVKP